MRMPYEKDCNYALKELENKMGWRVPETGPLSGTSCSFMMS